MTDRVKWGPWEVDSRSPHNPRKFWLMRFSNDFTATQEYIPHGDKRRREWASRNSAQRFADTLNNKPPKRADGDDL